MSASMPEQWASLSHLIIELEGRIIELEEAIVIANEHLYAYESVTLLFGLEQNNGLDRSKWSEEDARAYQVIEGVIASGKDEAQ